MDKIDISVKKMWEDYLTSIGESIIKTNKKYTSWHFCSDEKSANELARLVKEGVKRGTTSLYYLYEVENEKIPMADEYSVITNWSGIAECIIRTKKVRVLPFKDINEELAEIEGEGDKSLEYWKKAHIDVFIEELKELGMEFTSDMMVVFEEFEVVYK
ncbi:ASCH domain-containing protein [Clostridium sp. MB40-C1]|uniref:ASCH domain-containing protein n=1 Tax=Clostridium sp. MB40-C1 TaxID=3070996 RepID=UPI0027E0F1C9|nr:ASCH domain-containing protein [Clostridium sp. MB40-C1]WMJ82236.1 ASCH domain-containing protein [Clostridium sp. MB40-C1]